MTTEEIQSIIDYFNSIRNTNRIWVEAEIPDSSKDSFSIKYLKLTGVPVPTNSSSYPYYIWEPGTNTWGVELRVYFSLSDSIPPCLRYLVTDNSRKGYEQYDVRVNNNDVIWVMFANGFVLGGN